MDQVSGYLLFPGVSFLFLGGGRGGFIAVVVAIDVVVVVVAFWVPFLTFMQIVFCRLCPGDSAKKLDCVCVRLSVRFLERLRRGGLA